MKYLFLVMAICALGYINFHSESKHHALVHLGASGV